MNLEINQYHMFTLRIHTTILSKGGKVMYELVNLNSKLFERASIPPICYIDLRLHWFKHMLHRLTAALVQALYVMLFRAYSHTVQSMPYHTFARGILLCSSSYQPYIAVSILCMSASVAVAFAFGYGYRQYE